MSSKSIDIRTVFKERSPQLHTYYFRKNHSSK
jgi:hypothetical protein